MSGPNGDPDISSEDGIINDDDEFGDEGNTRWLLHNTTDNEPQFNV